LYLQAALFFSILAVATTLVGMVPGVIRARIWIGLPIGVVLVALSATAGLFVGGAPALEKELAAAALAVIVLTRFWVRRWSWVGAQLFAGATLAALAYLAYAGSITYGNVNGSPVYMVASTVLLLLELAALLLSVSYLFEIVDTLSRREDARASVDAAYRPKVAIQVPAYNEPVEVVTETLKSLQALDYPDLIVQVVDNNTPEESTWRALESLCKELGPRFQFMHLENWPGYKAGALNEATRRLPDDIELIGVVDSDYVVKPDWLHSVVGHFADPRVAFVQTPQNYRDWSDDQYLRGLYYSYRYFFDITMPARAHRNAIIFAGTMGIIRRKVFDDIGGWNPNVVTEDAEASLRMLALGHAGIFEPRAFGHGLMPLSFDGLKKQRFRWALGGVQILRLHWKRLLLPGDGGRLTIGQRVHYLLGNVQWFGDPLMACFTLLLVATALATAFHHQLPIRSLTGAVLGLPIAFLATGLLRAVWAMKLKTKCTWRDAIAGLQVWFALSWVVSLACIRGLLRFHTAFLRTPKRREGEGTWFQALRAAQVEVLLATTGLVAAVLMLVRAPSLSTVALSILLLFQASIYANAPWASVSAEGITLTPLRRAYRMSAQNTGARPSLGGGALLGVPIGLALGFLVLLVFASIATPPAAPIALAPPPPSHSPSPKASPSPSPSPSPTPSPSPSPSPQASPTPSPSPTASPS
jgi:cellulose synthase/poly-beta-1,6-N-acetylglucosamine synthase-like glycosyltransferase